MQPISVPYIYSLSATLRQLQTVTQGEPINKFLWVLMSAQYELEGFLFNSVYTKTVKASINPGGDLLQAIKKLTNDPNKTRNLDVMDTWAITNGLSTFEAVLTAEMNVCKTYLVTKKRGFDTSDLIDQAEVIFPPDLGAKAPEAIDDIRQAGKCIAFEIPTAAGFHLMRALELVLRLYFDVAGKGEPRPTTNNLGDYLRVLVDKNLGNQKLLAVLKQIKDLHRNEFIHPETTLTLDEAIGLVGITQSAMVYMLLELPERQKKLTAQSATGV